MLFSYNSSNIALGNWNIETSHPQPSLWKLEASNVWSLPNPVDIGGIGGNCSVQPYNHAPRSIEQNEYRLSNIKSRDGQEGES